MVWYDVFRHDLKIGGGKARIIIFQRIRLHAHSFFFSYDYCTEQMRNSSAGTKQVGMYVGNYLRGRRVWSYWTCTCFLVIKNSWRRLHILIKANTIHLIEKIIMNQVEWSEEGRGLLEHSLALPESFAVPSGFDGIWEIGTLQHTTVFTLVSVGVVAWYNRGTFSRTTRKI